MFAEKSAGLLSLIILLHKFLTGTKCPLRIVAAGLTLAVWLILASIGYSSDSPEKPATSGLKPNLPASVVIFDMPLDQVELLTGISRPEMAQRRNLLPITPTKALGTGKVIVLLMDWTDYPANSQVNTPGAFDTLFFSANTISPGSLHDYYLENSFGQFSAEGDVYGWFQLPSYDPNGWFYNELFALADQSIDFSQYDLDLDGNVDALWVVHAGPGQEETHDPQHIWSFATFGFNYQTNDGVIIDRFSVIPETHADSSISTIRVPCHEYGHILGLPDLYDYDDKLHVPSYYTPGDRNDHPLVNWDIMGYGGYNIMTYIKNSCPHHFCGWSKMKLGWITPIVLDTSLQGIRIHEIETMPESSLYKIPINGSSTEYFLVENRNPNSLNAKFDKYDSDFSAYFAWFTPGGNPLDSGLLITHIDDNLYPNSTGPSSPHYAVMVVDAGYNPNHPYDGVSEFTEWWYPYEFRIGAAFAGDDPGQTEFTPNTVPNSNGYYAPSNMAITNISNPGQVMSFDFNEAQCLAKPGDVNRSGGTPNLSDVIHLVNFVFDKSRVTPLCSGTDPVNCWPFDPICRGDVNGSGGTPNLQDVIYLVNFVFDKSRVTPPCNGTDPGNCWTPVSSGECCLP